LTRVFLFSATSIIAATLVMPQHAFAEAEASPDTQEIIVTGQVDGYRTEETRSGTKTSVPILDVPQSISVVTADQLRDENIRTMADLARLLPGVTAGQGEGHRDQLTLRGNNSTADFFVDGLRDDVQYYRSFYNIDRVEAHKGPNAMIFGRGGGGGIINRVSKSALVDKSFVSVEAGVDSFTSASIAADANIVMGPGTVRLNGFYESLDNHRPLFSGERYGVNPVLGAYFGSGVKVQLGYEYVKDDRAVDRGVPSAFAGSILTPAGPARGLEKTTFAVPDVNRTDFDAHIVRFKAEASVSDALTLSATALYGDYDKVYGNVFAVTPVSATNTVVVEAYRDPTKRQNLIAQTNLEWRVSTGPIDHILLIGGEYTDQDTRNARINGFFTPALNSASRRTTVALTPARLTIPAVRFTSGPTGNGNREVASTLSQSSAYIQDQIGLGEKFDLILGLRYDRLNLAVTNQFTQARAKRVDNLWSPRAGLIFKPVPQASLYASFSKSYLPQSGDQFLTFDATNATLKPERFVNYELGTKWDIRPNLSFTAAVYQLDRDNTRANGPVPGSIVLTGEQRSKGLELGLTGKVTSAWQTVVGYALTKAEITKTTSAAPDGRTLAQVPRHQFSLWNRYDFADSFGLGLGIYHQSKSFATISNATQLPAYTRVDAALFARLSDAVTAQMNIENLGNIKYFPTAHNDNNITIGAPRNVRFTLGVKF
jgi:catecholate siderophore receptor